MSETAAPAAQSFTLVYNGRTSFYDVHAAGCSHLSLYGQIYGRYAHMDVLGTSQATDAKAFKAEFEAGNPDCRIGKISPCAK